MYSVASLELELRNILNIPEGIGFGRLIGSVSDRLGDVVSISELIEIRRVRNIAAHPSPTSTVTKKDAENVLTSVDNILKRLKNNY